MSGAEKMEMDILRIYRSRVASLVRLRLRVARGARQKRTR
jgi:hypothetical protein